MKELSFPIQRTKAMKVLGVLWTGSVSGQIIVGALLVIGVFFMGNQRFSPISIIFFMVFILPTSFLIHRRLVSKGKKLMREWCDIRYYPESEVMEFQTGFPNTTDPDVQELNIKDDNRRIEIRGNSVGGYHLRLFRPKPERDEDDKTIENQRRESFIEQQRRIVRLGLWLDLDEAKQAANELNEFIDGEVTINIKEDEEVEK